MIRWPFTGPLWTRFRFTRSHWALLLGGLLLVAASLIGLRLLAPAGSASSGLGASDTMSSLRSTPGAEGGPAEATTGWQPLLGAVAAIAVVLGLLYGTLLVLRKLGQPGGLSRASAGLLRLQTTLRLGRDQALYLVQCGQEELLIGASPAGLVLLARKSHCEPVQESEFDHFLTAAVEERPL